MTSSMVEPHVSSSIAAGLYRHSIAVIRGVRPADDFMLGLAPASRILLRRDREDLKETEEDEEQNITHKIGR